MGPLTLLSMASTVLVDVVRGPEEFAGFGKSILIEPVQPTTRPDRYPTQAVVVTNAARRLIELSKAGERLDSIVVHGAMDPTLHPEFVEISENLRELCNKWFAKAQLSLFSEAPHLDDPLVRHALLAYDTVALRFESSTQKTFKALTGRDGTELKALVEHMGKLEHRNLVIRTRFVRGTIDNSTDSEVRGWLKLLANIKPATVQLEAVGKAADGLKAITKTRLTQISDQLTEKVGAQIEHV
ncbi:MAG: radical SAM protein [Planctomycetota bacterium]